MPLPILYSFRRCPYAMRARMALVASGQTCEIREVKLSAKPDALIAASAKGTVPVLLLPDTTVIDQSLDIMHWALAQNDPEQWILPDGQDTEALIAANDGPFKWHLDRYKYPDRHESDAREHRLAAVNIVMSLEARLSRHRFLAASRPTLADFAIMPFIRQFAGVDERWFAAQPMPHVQSWLPVMQATHAFVTAMARFPIWQDGADRTVFPPQ